MGASLSFSSLLSEAKGHALLCSLSRIQLESRAYAAAVFPT